MSEDKKRLIILDSNAIIHRSFHALPDFRTPRGELVNAVYGFISILIKVLKEFKPDYVAATFDVAGPTFRDEEYAEYKANRVKAPDELYAQIPMVKKVLTAFNISIYEKEGFEADDVIGTISKLVPKKQAHPPIETIIVSGDLDTLQLVDKHTKVYTMRKGMHDTVLYDEDAVEKRFEGVSAEQLIDYKGLRGDPSDNIPGVTGVGEKTAIRLLLDFGSLENLYKELENNTEKAKKLNTKLAERLLEYKDQAFFSRELATIRLDVPLEFNIKDLEWHDFDRAEVERVLGEFGFKSLLERLPVSESGGTNRESIIAKEDSQKEQADPALENVERFYKEGVFSKEIYNIEKKLLPVLRTMEKEGIKIDKKHFSKLNKEITKDLREAEKKIYKISGKNFNINSPQQLSEILFSASPDGLGLPTKGLKKTPGGVVSTAAPELEKLEGSHPLISHLLKYRDFQKLYSTYIKPLPEVADSNDRIHTRFDSLGTATGRLSSSKPNLQNIPVKGEWGTKIREGFVARDGYKIVTFDYSQMELRLAAHIAGDKKMKEFFEEDRDIHTMTAAEVFGVKPEDVSKEMRNRAKALNFGILYGMGASGFARSAGIPRDDAQAFIDEYFARFSSIQGYIEETKAFARNKGYVETLFGRKRYIPDILSSAPQLRAQAERMAINHPIQGAAADIIKMAMVAISDKGLAKSNDSIMLLQIHDELLFEIKYNKVDTLAPQIKSEMENVYKISVPIKVDVSVGDSWGALSRVG